MEALEAVGNHVGNAAGFQHAAISPSGTGNQKHQSNLIRAFIHDFGDGAV